MAVSPYHRLSAARPLNTSLGTQLGTLIVDRLPDSDDTLLIRTDFSDEGAWDLLCQAITRPMGDYQAHVHCVNDRSLEGVGVSQLVQLAAPVNQSFLLVADRESFSAKEPTVLAIDLIENPGRTFRLTPAAAISVENNLSIGNMDFSEFAEATDSYGVFRGFAEQS